MNLKIAIADDEQWICSLLVNLIHFEHLELELAGVANDGEELLALVEDASPDIVITDIYMPKKDGLECIRILKEKGVLCKFVIISGYRQFDYAYTALKYDVADYLLKPIVEDELNATLRRIVNDIRLSNKEAVHQDHKEAVQRLFLSKTIYELAEKPMSVEQVNQTYCTGFDKGIFCVAAVKMDFLDKTREVLENVATLKRKIQSIVEQQFGRYCHEILLETKFTEIIIIFNYSIGNSTAVKEQYPELLKAVNRSTDMFGDVNVTVCVGGEREDISEIVESREEALHVCWVRRTKGTGRVLFWKADEALPPVFGQKLEVLNQRMKKASEMLDWTEFERCVQEFFALPSRVIGHYEGKMFLRTNKDYLFSVNRELIQNFGDIDNMYFETRRVCNMANTLEEYEEVYLSQCQHIFDQISELSTNHKTRQVRMARAYVEQNYMEDIGLDEVAMAVDLSPAYFSFIFKQETGQNFIVYLTDLRIKKAKELLKSSMMTVREVGEAVGFTDQRYFSKTFKKVVGIKPTEYRKFYD